MGTVQKSDTEDVEVSEDPDEFFGQIDVEVVAVTEVEGLSKDTLDAAGFEFGAWVQVVNPFNYVQLYRED